MQRSRMDARELPLPPGPAEFLPRGASVGRVGHRRGEDKGWGLLAAPSQDSRSR